MLISYRLSPVYSTAISCAYYTLKYYIMNHYTILTYFGTLSHHHLSVSGIGNCKRRYGLFEFFL